MGENTSNIEVILGVETHLDQHVAVLVDSVGRVAGSRSVATNTTGYKELLDWANSIGQLTRAGVEGTGTYGAALPRMLDSHGVQVLEVNRPNRPFVASAGHVCTIWVILVAWWLSLAYLNHELRERVVV